jgi:hypothetical protein
MTRAVTSAAAETLTWPLARWARVLDRIEHRRSDVGLRFWAPPVWLEVTMTGPDSDGWPRTVGPDRAWDWQSSEACVEAMEAAAAGASDDLVLSVVARYAVENLVLNAVHEIGEWFRFDGRRVFPAHPDNAQVGDGKVSDDLDGNGWVHLEFGYPPAVPPARVAVSEPGHSLRDRVTGIVAAPRFTYLPGTSISYGRDGPAVAGPDGAAGVWRSAWSLAVRQEADAAVAADCAGGLIDAVAADVHRALVHYEADRVCRAFHVDGHRVWTLASADPGRRDPEELTDPPLQPLRIAIVHADRLLPGRGPGSPSRSAR